MALTLSSKHRGLHRKPVIDTVVQLASDLGLLAAVMLACLSNQQKLNKYTFVRPGILSTVSRLIGRNTVDTVAHNTAQEEHRAQRWIIDSSRGALDCDRFKFFMATRFFDF